MSRNNLLKLLAIIENGGELPLAPLSHRRAIREAEKLIEGMRHLTQRQQDESLQRAYVAFLDVTSLLERDGWTGAENRNMISAILAGALRYSEVYEKEEANPLSR